MQIAINFPTFIHVIRPVDKFVNAEKVKKPFIIYNLLL